MSFFVNLAVAVVVLYWYFHPFYCGGMPLYSSQPLRTKTRLMT